MIAPILFALALVVTFELSRRSLGLGIASALTVGYFHGVLRANILSPFITFLFDAALLGLYAGAYMRCKSLHGRAWKTPLGRWTLLLILWPALLTLIPVNHLLIQFVALHASVWFALMLMIGSQVSWADMKVVGRWLAILNIIALGVGIYLYVVGVPALYPVNAVTEFTLRSRDVANGQWRIPSIFLQAHAYAGSMLLSLPFLAAIGLDGTGIVDKALSIVGAIAAVGGVLICGARQPVVVGLAAGLVTLVLSRANPRMLVVVVCVLAGAILVASQDERMQRSMTLLDTDFLQERVESSVNLGFVDLLFAYPLGAGMGSAFGTSIPSFLADYAPAQTIGMENEFSRIQVNQGIIGLAIWIAFLIWYLRQAPGGRVKPPLAVFLAYGLTTAYWSTAWIGAGTTSSVPSSAAMFLLQGIVVASVRERKFANAGLSVRRPVPVILPEKPLATLGDGSG